jgi:biotin carboxylase
MLLFTTTGYEAREFVQAAQQLGVDTVLGSDRCHVLDDPWQDGALPLRFERPQEAAQHILDYARSQPLVRSSPLVIPSAHCRPGKPGFTLPAPQPRCCCRQSQQIRMRRSCATRVCGYRGSRVSLQADPRVLQHEVLPMRAETLALSASRGVMRANTPEEFVKAFWRLRALLETPAIRLQHDEVHDAILVERFIPGFEVALEGLLTAGRMQVLALFDKPDPLDGPFFEETLYITPSRLKAETQDAITRCTEQAAHALGLVHGPLHAELRINQEGPWILEVAARAIGGL